MKSSCCGGTITPTLPSGAGSVCPVPTPPLPAVGQSVFIKGAGSQGPKGDPGADGLDGADGVDGEDGADAVLPPGLVESYPLVVMTWAELVAACAAGERLIQLGNDLTSESNLLVPREVNVSILPYRITQGGAHTFKWLGGLPPQRTQVFEGFTKGQIKGTFGTGYVIPEWWGLIGDSRENGQHDVAINCAIQCQDVGAPVCVSLGGYSYYVARPLDLRETSSRIQGVTSRVSSIYSSMLWDPGVWEGHYSADVVFQPPNDPPILGMVDATGGKVDLTVDAGSLTEFFAGDGNKVKLTGATNAAHNGEWLIDAVLSPTSIRIVLAYGSGPGAAMGKIKPVTLDSVMETGAGSASALIWIGSIIPQTYSDFFSGVSQVNLDAYEACVKFPLKRMSVISWTGWVEENTVIHDVYISYFTGFGIGGINASNTSVINGLTVSKFTIASGFRRFAVAIYVPIHAGVFSIRDGTINNTISEGNSITGTDVYKRVPAQFGILAAGSHTIIEGVHIESCMNGIHVFARNAVANVTIRQCRVHHMMNIGQRFVGDTARKRWALPDWPAELAADNWRNQGAALYHVGVGVSIGAHPYENLGHYGGLQTTTVDGLALSSENRFVLIDAAYGVWLDAFDGHTPSYPMKNLGFYTRGVPEVPPKRAKYRVAGPADALQGGGPNSGTLLTITDPGATVPADFILNNPMGTYPDTSANPEMWKYAILRAKPDATSLVVQIPYNVANLNSTGTVWATIIGYNTASPSTAKQFKLGPVY